MWRCGNVVMLERSDHEVAFQAHSASPAVENEHAVVIVSFTFEHDCQGVSRAMQSAERSSGCESQTPDASGFGLFARRGQGATVREVRHRTGVARSRPAGNAAANPCGPRSISNANVTAAEAARQDCWQ
jgi:hypothetical protein